MDDIVSYQFAQVRQRRDERQEIQYELILRQQPKQSRMCGIGEKADRRPIDPPPIIQLKVYDASLPQSEKSSFLQNPYFFMYASLVAPDTDEELHLLRDGKTRSTTGSVVSSLYHLKDIDNSDAGFFVFPDLSVRMEGTYRLKLSLFEIIGREVYHCKSIFSDIFIVYSAKRFPGMEESTFLSRSFADQGLKIRIRRLAKRDRKELELIDQSISNRLKRQRPDGKRDDESGDSSDVDMRDRTPNAEDVRPKIAPDTARKDHISISPASPRRGPGPYEHIPPHMAHYDPSMYGPGYPSHVRPLPWHDRPEYLPPEHYPPYYDPYDRRYGYHPYYYPHPPPLPDGADHHRYPYPPPAYGRPPMYPGQPAPYYDTPPRVGHPAGESPGAVRPYGYDPSNPYPPQRAPWPHYDYYASYAHPPPMVHPPPKPMDYATQETGDPQSKIPIQDLLSTEQQQQQQGQPQNQSQNQSQQNQQQNQQQSSTSQPNSEQNAAVPPLLHQQRMYGVPPSAFGLYPHPRPHEYMRHDMYRSPYDMVYPPHDPTVPQYGQNTPPVNKPQPTSQPPQTSQGDTARTSLMPATPTPASSSSESVRQESRNVEYNSYNDSSRRSAYPEREPLTSTTNPSSTPTSQAPSSYSGMPAIPTPTRTPVSLPPLSFVASSGNSIPAYHSATSASSLLTSTSSSKSPPQLKSPQPPQSSFDHSQSYSQSTSNSQRGTYGMNSGSDLGNGGNSSKNNGVNSNLGSGNEKPTLSTSPRAAAGFEGKYPLRRQGGDVEGERNVNESVGNNEKY